ncbi:hypothetical protein W97_03175 [Coniosporium apollinis CBS 100218]|uniref:Uncharacterized protein n=1 Tax=Coniosporium apollinis (strain CBS 100218) TaxID=1168221 RepID=R7YQJ2_CONA1|nr:uncharacterized protein W97_03175 [Coniosporium apollinis CBS 100218]EON63946.1 hypothetical protein W97_03175 [Coniosporium apollinis CBS 100218]
MSKTESTSPSGNGKSPTARRHAVSEQGGVVGVASVAISSLMPGRLRDIRDGVGDMSYKPSHCDKHETMRGYCPDCEGPNVEQGRAYCAARDFRKVRKVIRAIGEARDKERRARVLRANIRDKAVNAMQGINGCEEKGRSVRFDDKQVHRLEAEYRPSPLYSRSDLYYAPGRYADHSGNGIEDTSFMRDPTYGVGDKDAGEDRPVSKEEKNLMKVENYFSKLDSHMVALRNFETSQEAAPGATEDMKMSDWEDLDEDELKAHLHELHGNSEDDFPGEEELVGEELEAYLRDMYANDSDDFPEDESSKEDFSEYEIL